MSTELAGRTALVTGAGNGLGRAIALGLARAGADVVLAGRTRATLEQTAALLPDPSRGRVAVCNHAPLGKPARATSQLGGRGDDVACSRPAHAGRCRRTRAGRVRGRVR